jgi:rRNA biogenesis protein RRP5
MDDLLLPILTAFAMKTLPASITSIEDHGYTLDFGIHDVVGFLSFKDVKDWERSKGKLKVGMLVDTIVRKMEENGRMCTVSIGEDCAKSEVRIRTIHPTSQY